MEVVGDLQEARMEMPVVVEPEQFLDLVEPGWDLEPVTTVRQSLGEIQEQEVVRKLGEPVETLE